MTEVVAEKKLPIIKITIDWYRFHADARRLIKNLPRKDWEALVIITRGGLVLGATVARELNMRKNIATICISSYHDYRNQGDLKADNIPASEILALPRDKVLVVDDVCDTGETFDYIQKHILPGAYYAATYVKPKGRPFVHLFAQDFAQNEWLQFPWDLDLSVHPPFIENGESTA